MSAEEPAAKKAKTEEAVAAAHAAPTTLHSYWRSSCSWRVRIALAWKGIEYEYRAVHLLNSGGEQLLEPYTALNPMRELPTLEIDGLVLTQSLSILEYLEETRPGLTPLLPAEPAAKARVRQLSELISGIQTVQNLRVLKRIMANYETKEEKTAEKLKWGKHWINNGFVALEKELEGCSGVYCCGDMVTLADLCLVPQVYNANRFGVNMAQFPLIATIDARLAKLSAFEKAHPSQQPDAV